MPVPSLDGGWTRRRRSRAATAHRAAPGAAGGSAATTRRAAAGPTTIAVAPRPTIAGPSRWSRGRRSCARWRGASRGEGVVSPPACRESPTVATLETGTPAGTRPGPAPRCRPVLHRDRQGRSAAVVGGGAWSADAFGSVRPAADRGRFARLREAGGVGQHPRCVRLPDARWATAPRPNRRPGTGPAPCGWSARSATPGSTRR